MTHPAFTQAHNLLWHMVDYANIHGRNLGFDNVDKITGHLRNAMNALQSADTQHKTQPFSTSAMLELHDAGHHLNQAAKAFDIRDEMGQRIDYPLTTEILQAQLGKQQKEFVDNYTNDMNEGRKNGR